jgi:hypothetical protein
MKRPRTRARIVCLSIVGLVLGCSRRVDRGEGNRSAAMPSAGGAGPVFGLAPSPGQREPQVRRAVAPTQLMADATSAYNAGLVLDDDDVYLLTSRVVYRLVPGAKPQPIAIENGGMAALTRTGLISWARGAIWRTPKLGGKAERVASLAHQPQFFMAAGQDIAWLDMPVHDEFLIQTLDGDDIRTLFYCPERIETAAMDAGWVFFVRREGNSWRIGSVSVHGGDIRYGRLQNGPTPAKLAVAGEVFYYDLASGELRRLSPDLSHEDVLSKDLVCSPIAVAAKIYCPNAEGLFALARQPGAKSTRVFPEPRRIAAVAANTHMLAWLSDAGADRLSLMAITLANDE